MKIQVLLCCLLCLCAVGCYTTESLPMKSAQEIARFQKPIETVMIKARLSDNVDNVRKIPLDGCPEDFKEAFATYLARFNPGAQTAWLRGWLGTAPGSASLVAGDTAIRDAEVKLSLVCKSYGVKMPE